MNFRNKYLLNSVRIVLGLFMLFSGVSGFVLGPDAAGTPEDMVPFLEVLADSGIFHMIKVTEIVVGLMLVAGFLPWLAAIILAPLSVGIIVFNANVVPQYVISGVIVALLNAYLGYAYWSKYKPLFDRKL